MNVRRPLIKCMAWIGSVDRLTFHGKMAFLPTPGEDDGMELAQQNISVANQASFTPFRASGR